MDIEKLLAVGMVPSIRVRYGPDIEDAVFIDANAFELNKTELKRYCQSIPNANAGLSWRLLMPWTGGNGLMAKVLVMLGEMVGAWKAHPPLESPAMWNRKLHPMIRTGSLVQEAPVASRVPKPSRGDLEAGTQPCRCCKRPMGPTDSVSHDLVEAGNGYCMDCNFEDCDDMSPCRVFHKPVEKQAEQVLEAPDGIDEYLRRFGG